MTNEIKEEITNSIYIDKDCVKVWSVITDIHLMKKWMGEPDMSIDIITDWVVGNPIIVSGFHHVNFINTGKVLCSEPYNRISYSSKSSLSHLDDKAESYTVISFILKPSKSGTLLTINLQNFPNEVIKKHHELYWRTTIILIKKLIENL